MSITFNYTLSQYGEELEAYKSQSQRTLDTLTTVQNRLITLKETIQNDGTLEQSVRDSAVIEVETALSDLITQIKDYAANLP